MDLKATACSRLRVNPENFQTRISVKGALDLAASSITIRNWGLSVIRLLSASSTYSRTTIRPELKGSYSAEGSCSTTISTGALRATISSIGSVRLSLTG